MIPSFRLDGSVALVTGAAGGIGARVALGPAEFGADVGCPDTADPAKTVAAIQEIGRRAVGIEADVADAAQVDAAVARVQDVLGPLRHAVNCAGIHSTRHPAGTPGRDRRARRTGGLPAQRGGVVRHRHRPARRRRRDPLVTTRARKWGPGPPFPRTGYIASPS